MSAVHDWQLERYVLGELPARETEAVRAALEQDEDLRDRLRALERSNAEILGQHPAPAFAAAIAQRASPPVPRRATHPRLALAAALGAAALVAGVVLLRPAPGARDAQDVTRIKGSVPRLALYRKGPGGIEALPSGSVARGHDLVQLSYQAAGRRYGVIVSVDGNGAITRHLPAQGAMAAPLARGAVALPEAYELDDAPRFERFYFVAADEPFPVETVIEAVQGRQEADDRLDLPAAWAVSSLLLKKP
jgi:anti-sigma factor RsiW